MVPQLDEIASLAGVGTATVDRVLNARGQVSQATKMKVLDALAQLQKPRNQTRRRFSVVCESGDSFNRSLTEAVESVAWRRQDLELVALTFSSFEVQLIPFAQQIEREADLSDGIILVAREDATVVRAARAVMRRGKPVVCLATDLPRSCRHGFVGSDERSAGKAAAELLGDLIRGDEAAFCLLPAGPTMPPRTVKMAFAPLFGKSIPT